METNKRAKRIARKIKLKSMYRALTTGVTRGSWVIRTSDRGTEYSQSLMKTARNYLEFYYQGIGVGEYRVNDMGDVILRTKIGDGYVVDWSARIARWASFLGFFTLWVASTVVFSFISDKTLHEFMFFLASGAFIFTSGYSATEYITKRARKITERKIHWYNRNYDKMDKE